MKQKAILDIIASHMTQCLPAAVVSLASRTLKRCAAESSDAIPEEAEEATVFPPGTTATQVRDIYRLRVKYVLTLLESWSTMWNKVPQVVFRKLCNDDTLLIL